MKKTENTFRKNLKQFFKFFDLYGQNVNLFIDKKPKFYTTCSGIISMAVIFFIIFTFMGFINSWLNKENLTPIPSSISYSVLQLLSENKNYEYEFGYKNYPFYWSFYSDLPNGTELEIQDLQTYFTFNVTYIDENLITKELPTEHCKIDQQDIFLGFDQAKIDQDAGKTSIYRICIKENYKMGIFPNSTLSTVNNPNIIFSFYQCVNSTINNNSCVSQEAIDEITKYTTIQATVPTTLYDFKNTKNPQKNIYDYRLTNLDKSMLKYYKNKMTTSNIYIDYGLLYDDYRLHSTNFNPSINYDPEIRKDNDPLYTFVYTVGLNTQNYYLRNQKINEIAGNLGGLINTIFLIGKIFCIAYNSIYLKFEIISSTFAFSSTKKDKPKILPSGPRYSMENLKISIANKIASSFSYCSYLFPSKDVRIFYQNGSKYLNEYMDIRKIIKRLQDLDKLKMILLSEDQRKLFEHIPKPEVVYTINKSSLDSVSEFKRKGINNGNTSNITKTIKSMIENKDPTNTMTDRLDSNLKVKLEDFGIFFFLFQSFKNISHYD